MLLVNPAHQRSRRARHEHRAPPSGSSGCCPRSTGSATRTQGEPLARPARRDRASSSTLLEEDLDRLYDNWFIETCDEWVVPYLGDLLGVAGSSRRTRRGFSQRGLVANTLALPAGKGTAAVLEQLARDVTGWPAKAIEYFDWLATTRAHEPRAPERHRVRGSARRGATPSSPGAVRPRRPHGRRAPHRQRARPPQHPERRDPPVAPAVRVPLDMEEAVPSAVVGGAEARPVEAATPRAGASRSTRSASTRRCSTSRGPSAAITELAAEANVPGAASPPPAAQRARAAPAGHRRRRRLRRASGSTTASR